MDTLHLFMSFQYSGYYLCDQFSDNDVSKVVLLQYTFSFAVPIVLNSCLPLVLQEPSQVAEVLSLRCLSTFSHHGATASEMEHQVFTWIPTYYMTGRNWKEKKCSRKQCPEANYITHSLHWKSIALRIGVQYVPTHCRLLRASELIGIHTRLHACGLHRAVVWNDLPWNITRLSIKSLWTFVHVLLLQMHIPVYYLLCCFWTPWHIS